MLRQACRLLVFVCLGAAAIVLYAWLTTGTNNAYLTLETERWDLGKSIAHDFANVVVSEGRVSFESMRADSIALVEQTDRTLTVGRLPLNLFPVSARLGDRPFSTSWWKDFPAWAVVLMLLILPMIAGVRVLIALRRQDATTPNRRVVWLAPPLRIARGISILLFAASIALCVRSYPYFERMDLRLLPGPAGVQVNSSRGSIMFAWTELGPARTLANGGLVFFRSTIPPDRGPLRNAAGFKGPSHTALGFSIGTDGSTPLMWNVVVMPYWFVFVVTAALVYVSDRLFRRTRDADKAAREGFCPACDYDLRGSRERCPECGLVI